MAKYLKPLLNKIWAESGDMDTPTDSKIGLGWVVEKPPLQYFNYLDNKQDTALAYLNQQGIPEWDSVTEYQESTSYVQASDGLIYKAKTTHTNQNPISDTSQTNWKVAFAQQVAVPSTAASSGVKGSFAFDSSYIYICTATDTWKRVAIATW